METKNYQLSISNSVVNIQELEMLDFEISERLRLIEKEIIEEYLINQKDRIGIKTLGKKLQYNKKFKSLFGKINSQSVIIQATENKRALMRIIFETLSNYKGNTIYFFLLQSQFGKISNLFDSTFININDVEKNINLILDSADFKPVPNFRIIEMHGFSEYFVESKNGYTKLVKLNNE
ncbi:hypothetical protein [Sphingobacterium mizutaii]|uniref:hypothetical protein n=1 Tax=Sphingobacterium mizutaii TaxID=1010 RepID=UPI0028A231A0|nr:hypothetical protein [Sphingobacterium mizutaii]